MQALYLARFGELLGGLFWSLSKALFGAWLRASFRTISGKLFATLFGRTIEEHYCEQYSGHYSKHFYFIKNCKALFVAWLQAL